MATGERPNRRKAQRMALAIPVRVQGFEADGGTWYEMSITEDTDFGGAAFHLKHPVALGHVLYLSLPLPKAMRRYDLTSPSYAVYAVVRNTRTTARGQRVGVMFIGRTPPRGFAEKPAGRFLLPTDRIETGPARGERRRSVRHTVAVPVKLVRTATGAGAAEEQTITVNVGTGGAMVFTSLPLARGDTVLLEHGESGFRARAQVQNLFTGTDNVPRLNLRFADADAEEAVKSLLRRLGIFG